MTTRAATLNGLPNGLDKFDQATYHFKLFMMPQSFTQVPVGAAMNVDSSKGTIIAESGVTSRLFIEDVDMKTVTNASKISGNNTALDFNINIREIGGATLLDNIYFASVTLGIDNYFNAPYFLELTFLGRDPDSSNPIDKPLDNLKWVWPLRILSTATEVDAGGTTYNIKSVLYDHLGHNKEVANFDQPFIASVKDVGGAIDILISTLNEREKQKTITDTTDGLINQFDIKVPAEWRSRKLVVTSEVDSQKSATNISYQLADYRNMSIKEGTSLTRAINSILMSTEEYQKDIINQEEKGEKGPDGKAKKGKPRIMHRVDVVTSQGPFDNKRGGYQMTYTYKVIPFSINTLVFDANDLTISSVDRVQQAISNNTLKKEYNYVFTGLNDQVLEFNMKFNFGWTAGVSAQGGYQTTGDNVSEGKTINKKYVDQRDTKRKNAAFQKNAASSPIADNSTGGEAGKPAATSANELLGGVADNSNEKRQKEIITKSKQEGAPKKASVGPRQRFISDLTEDKALGQADMSKQVIPFSLQNKAIDTKQTENMNNDHVIEGDLGPGRKLTDSLFEQAFSGKTGDLVHVDLIIKGDPFWLESQYRVPGAGSVIYQNIMVTQEAYKPDGYFANTMAYENYFVFRVRTPELPDENTGLISARKTALDGVYGVITVKHNFSGGKFTQTLTAVIDPVIKLQEVDNANVKIS